MMSTSPWSIFPPDSCFSPLQHYPNHIWCVNFWLVSRSGCQGQICFFFALRHLIPDVEAPWHCTVKVYCTRAAVSACLTMKGKRFGFPVYNMKLCLCVCLCVASPGGFKGCGHGHKGHPGRPHWSCCGNTAEKSECLPQSVLAAVSPRGHLRTVELWGDGRPDAHSGQVVVVSLLQTRWRRTQRQGCFFQKTNKNETCLFLFVATDFINSSLDLEKRWDDKGCHKCVYFTVGFYLTGHLILQWSSCQ